MNRFGVIYELRETGRENNYVNNVCDGFENVLTGVIMIFVAKQFERLDDR